jgi:hypothetical protein
VHLLAAHVVRQHAHAGALQHGELEREQVVRGVHRAVLQLEVGVAGPDQVPRGAAIAGTHRHRRQVVQFPGAVRRAEALQQLRAGHQQAARGAELLHHQRAAVVEVRAHADRDVHAFLQQVDDPVAHLHVDAHLRMRGQEARQHGADGGLRQGHRARDAHRAARFALDLRDCLIRRLGLLAHRHAVPVVDLAGLRQRQLARRPLQQPDSESGLEVGDAARQLRFGHVQGASGRRETAAVDDLGKEEHVVEILHDRPMVRTI